MSTLVPGSGCAGVAGASAGASIPVVSTRSSGSGAQERHRPSSAFQQLPQVYCRQSMQKLNVLWKASSCVVVALISSAWRASAIASDSDIRPLRTKLRRPLPSVRTRPSGDPLGALDWNV